MDDASEPDVLAVERGMRPGVRLALAAPSCLKKVYQRLLIEVYVFKLIYKTILKLSNEKGTHCI